MPTDADFLKKIAVNPRDDHAHLVYADWLEEHGDLRAEFLRLQLEAVRVWSYENPWPDALLRLAQLRLELDPVWISKVRRCTTPPPPLDVAKLLPDLKRRAKTTVRLHPRAGKTAIGASKIGGKILWPKSEPWPVCEEHESPYVPALQLTKADVPELPFPEGKDLFQVLWCPNDHSVEVITGPAPRVHWWTRAEIKEPRRAFPEPKLRENFLGDVPIGYVPQEYVVYPERVLEYPDPIEEGVKIDSLAGSDEIRRILELTPQLLRRPLHDPDRASRIYQCWLSAADGTKINGHPHWAQFPEEAKCRCGRTMDCLLNFARWECDSVTEGRWRPIEDRGIDLLSSEDRLKSNDHPKWDIGGSNGMMYIFACRHCEEWPTETFVQ